MLWSDVACPLESDKWNGSGQVEEVSSILIGQVVL